MAGHEWDDWFEREEFIGQISDIRVQNLQVEREVVQKRTFTRWMNLHLEKCNPPLEVRDLFRDIQDGRILMALLEELSGSKLLHGFKPSSHRIFRLNNIAKVLAFLEERNVKLVSIDAADVADGNSSIILGLIWNIILFFQIKELTGHIRSQFPSTSSLSSLPNSSDSDTSHSSTPSEERNPSTALRDHGRPIKTLLQWVQRRTRKYGVAVQDFGKSWTSGLAFLAVIKSIDSSLVDMRRALLRSSRENLEDAFRTAHYSLGIPRLLEPEDVTINAPDEQSIMTYVSQFLEHFPGFDEDEMPNATERNMLTRNLSTRANDTPVNGVHRKREKPYVVRKDWVQPPPKIFISSLSQEKEKLSSPLQTPGLEDSSDSVFLPAEKSQERPQDLGKEVSFTVSSSSSPQPSFVDSVIDSPDSWSDITSEAVTPETKLEKSQSHGLLNENDLPFDRRDWPLEKPVNGGEALPAECGKAKEDQVCEELFIDEGNFSESSTESFQAKSKTASEEEDAYQYIMSLNEEETVGPSSPGKHDDLDKMTSRLSSVPEETEETSVTQSKEEAEQCDGLHGEAESTTLLENSREPSTEKVQANDIHSKNIHCLGDALEHESTSTSQNSGDHVKSTPDLPQEKNSELMDTVEQQDDSACLKTVASLQQPPSEICVEQASPSELEELNHAEIPSNSKYSCSAEATNTKNPIEDITTIDAADNINGDNCLASNELCRTMTGAPCEEKLTEENVGAPDEANDRKNDGTSCAPGANDEHWDTDNKAVNGTSKTEGDTLTSLERKFIVPEIIETLAGQPPKSPTEEEDTSSHLSAASSQNSPREPEAVLEEFAEDHSYLSWTAGPDSGDDSNDPAEEADENCCSSGLERGPVSLRGSDSVLELKPAPDGGRALDSGADSQGSGVESTENSSQEKDRQEGQDTGFWVPRWSEHLGEDARDCVGTDLDKPSKFYELIKTDKDPVVVASENTETQSGKKESEDSKWQSHISCPLPLTKDMYPDGLKVQSSSTLGSGQSLNFRQRHTSPVTTDEIHWLLLLWLLLYCFFVLPQIDINTLPYLLFNLEE
ncbi:hypothetical protein GJAV_G00010720 [Gymnothorax javanicus]|nr:hypothetical protein GJAV_G00010720 [Gymnothorax javanicus]